MALYDASFYPGQPSGFLSLNNGMGVADPMQWMNQSLTPAPLVPRPVASAPASMSNTRSPYMGLAGTFGDQAGDFDMPSSAVNPGWASAGAGAAGSGFWNSIGLGGVGDSIGNFMENSGILGKTLPDGTKLQGWGGLALGGISAGINAWTGMQQYQAAKDQLNFQKDAFAKNFGAQKQSMNTQLEDRQRARIASNPGAYESLSTYMDRNGIK